MANRVGSNPVFLDTFSSDVTITSAPTQIKAIYFETNLNNDVLTLEDTAGNWVFRVPVSADTVNNGTNYDQPTGKWVIFSDDNPLRCDGLKVDVSDGNYDGTCYAFIIL